MYTDEYSEVQDEEVVSNNPKPSFNINIKIVVIVVLVLIMIGLIIFILQKNKGGKSEYVLNIRPEVITIPLGKTQNIAYDVRKNGIVVPDAIVHLIIEDDTIARLDSTVITALNYGKTKLTATYVSENGKTYQNITDITVAEGDPGVILSSVTFPDGDLQMPLGGAYDIELTVTPPNGYIESKVITSSDSNIVLIDEKGTLNAVGLGVATVTVDINRGLFVKEFNVSVSGNSSGISKFTASPTAISLSRNITSLNEGETATLKYTITPSNASTSSLKWKSSDTKVLTVDNGKLKAIKEGSATITVTTSNNISDSVTITVNKKGSQISKIDFPMNDFAFLVGQSQLITPTITPSDAKDVKLTYTSSDPSIVSVTPSSDTLSATLNALKSGTVVLTIQSGSVEKKINVYAIG